MSFARLSALRLPALRTGAAVRGYATHPAASTLDAQAEAASSTRAKDMWGGSNYQIQTAKQKEALEAVRTAWRDAYSSLSAEQKSLIDPEEFESRFRQVAASEGEPIRVAVTGAAGAIGYSTLFRIASGGMFGPKTPVHLSLLELPGAVKALEGVVMELRDCAFPTLKGITVTDNAEKAFEAADYALLIGAQPRTKGMERGDLLQKNAAIFSEQGKALNKVGKGKGTRVVVVGNPANTNALIASRNAPKIPAENFIAMTRLDHNRGLSQIAAKADCHVDDIENFAIWGNHSATQFPNIAHATIKGVAAPEILPADWVESTFIPTVQKRGAEIIAARGASSAASAGSSAIDNVIDWHYGTNGQWTSAAVSSKGEYGITEGLFFSYPVIFNRSQQWSIVNDLPIDANAQQKIETTHKELLEERDAVAKLLPK